MGLPYYANIDQFRVSQTFIERNNVRDRAAVANKVLEYIMAVLYPKASVYAVLGHSEGSDVAARLAAMNKKITHLCFSAGSGHNVLMDYITLMRRNMLLHKISAADAEKSIQNMFEGMRRVLHYPDAIDSTFMGDTYRWWSAIQMPAIDYLLKISIPIFLTIGSHDQKVPAEGSDFIQAEFIRHNKSNLTYKTYNNCNHDYIETLPDGATKNRFEELFKDFLLFIEMHISQ